MQFKTHLHEGLGGYSLYIVYASLIWCDTHCPCHEAGNILVVMPTGTNDIGWEENHAQAQQIVQASNAAGHLIVSDDQLALGLRVTEAGRKAMRILHQNWNSMTEEEQDAWSIERYLQEEFPGLTFSVTAQPFNVRVCQDGADLKAIQEKVDEWYVMAYGPGAHVEWGTPVHVDA